MSVTPTEIQPTESQPILAHPSINFGAADGQTLQTMLEAGKRWNENEALELLLLMLDALKYLHTLSPQKVHGNITPHTIIRTKNGRFQLTAPTLRGTPTDDIYALGSTIIELMSGYNRTEIAQFRQELGLDKIATMTPRFESILNQMLEPNSDSRFLSAHTAHAMCLDLVTGSRVALRSQLPQRSSRDCPVYDPQSNITWSPDEMVIDIPGRISPKFKLYGTGLGILALSLTIWFIFAYFTGAELSFKLFSITLMAWLGALAYLSPAWVHIKIRLTREKFYIAATEFGTTKTFHGPINDFYPLDYGFDQVHGKSFKALKLQTPDFETQLIDSATDQEKDWLLEQVNNFLAETRELARQPKPRPGETLKNDLNSW